MRSEQRIGYIVLRGKCRYRRSEIDRLLADCTVAEDAATLTELETQPHAAHGRRQTQRKEDIRYGTAYTKQF